MEISNRWFVKLFKEQFLLSKQIFFSNLEFNLSATELDIFHLFPVGFVRYS